MSYEDYMDHFENTTICRYSKNFKKTGSLLLQQESGSSNLIEFEVTSKTPLILKVN